MKSIDALILAGGLGMRLRSVVCDRPKPLAEVGGHPFLDIIINYVSNYGFRRFILCVGYQSDVVKAYYHRKVMSQEIVFSDEDEALGTGGAVKNAKRFIQSNSFLVMNGDSYCPVDFHKFVNFHLDKKALVSMVLTKTKQNQNCGKVTLDGIQRIINFQEKGIVRDKGYDNAGIYLMEERIFSLMNKKEKFSLEHDLFPEIVDQECYGYITSESLIDIGTPEEFRKAQRLNLVTNKYD